jgi:hypothetical protein
VQTSDAAPREWILEPGLQILEVPALASPGDHATRIRITSEGRRLYDAPLRLVDSPSVTPADYVDVFLGTAHSRWMIAPGPWMPFGMVKISPDNQTQGWIAGYEYSSEFIDCFSHIHEWTMGGLGMMPTIGPLRTQPGLDGSGYSSRFDKKTERGESVLRSPFERQWCPCGTDRDHASLIAALHLPAQRTRGCC